MKLIKRILFVVLGLVVIVVIVGFLSPRVAHIERSLMISGDSATVFALVNSPAEFRKWSPWTAKDPNMQVETYGPDAGVGSGFSWKSSVDGVGEGKWMLSASKPHSNIGVDLTLEMADAKVNFDFVPKNDCTMVKWSLDIDMGMNPIGRLFGLGLESQVAPDYEQGLKNLEAHVSKLPKGRIENIEVITVGERHALGMRTTVPTHQIGNAIGQMLPVVMAYLNENKIKPAGAPFSVYHHWDPTGSTDFTAAIFTDKLEKGNERIKSFTLPAGKVVVANYFGPYQKIEKAYTAIDAWATKNNTPLYQEPWEEYITDPGTEPDANKWMTKVCFAVK